MEKTIVNYDKEQGIIIDCTQIKESEHLKAREEAEQLGFSFDSIDSDSFRAYCSKENINILSDLEKAGYTF